MFRFGDVIAWTVRTKEGSLQFHDFAQLEWAFRNGLIAPDDEIRDPGKPDWRKAGEHPHLLANRMKQKKAGTSHAGGVVLALVFALFALVMLAMGYWLIAIGIGMGLSFYMLRLNRRVMRVALARTHT